MRLLVLAAATSLAACASSTKPEAPSPTPQAAAQPAIAAARPLVIAHRGASGLRPEHTLAAYALAIDQGADFIEPDLVLTADGVLVARHDRYLSTTTDVADRSQFADRLRRDPSGETERSDWWVSDFTLAELKTLRARQSFPGRSTAFDDQFAIPTFAEVAALARARGVGVYPEMKGAAAHAQLGFKPVEAVATALAAAGWSDREAAVIVQSFEPAFLVALNARTDVRLVQLASADDWRARAAAAGQTALLTEIAAYADGLGPEKTLIIDETGRDTELARAARAAGLMVHPWTVRDDAPPADGASVEVELRRLFAAGADGVFADFPGTAATVRDEAIRSPRPDRGN